MYQQFFNFTTAPFSIAPDPHFIYMSEHHQEGLAHLLYGINQGGGFVALTGEVGTGKTTLCHCLLQQLPDNINIALVLNSKLNAIELLATICDELHIIVNKNEQTLKGLVDNLNKYLLAAHAAGKRTVLIIDEAQNLSLDVLEQVRLLTNLETSTTKLLQIILLAQPELKLLLEKPTLRQLNQRITARYHLTAFSYDDTQYYIKHRLKLSGGNTHIFNRRAIKRIYSLSKGIPRLINIICDRALLGAYVNDTQQITVKIINQAAKEVFNVEKKSNKMVLVAILLSILMMVLVGSSFYLTSKQQLSQPVNQLQLTEKSVDKKSLPKTEVDLKKQVTAIEVLDFKNNLKTYGIPLNRALLQLAKIWGHELTQKSGCEEIEAAGVYCLFDKSAWDDLVALNRPVIMEFNAEKTEEVYVLLVGLKQGNPVFFIDKEMTFPLQQVLKQWTGYYLMLWQPPIPEVIEVAPKIVSHAVLWIKSHLLKTEKKDYSTIVNSTLFDESLKQAVLKFQRTKGLTADGIVGPRTFIHLKNSDPHNNSPKLRLID